MMSARFLDTANAKDWAALFELAKSKPFAIRRELYRAYLRSNQWAFRRQCEMRRAGRKCELCGMMDRMGIPLQVHHTSYEHLGDEHAGELQVLCRLCHEETHGKGSFSITAALGGIENPEDRRIREENLRARGHYSDLDEHVLANRRLGSVRRKP